MKKYWLSAAALLIVDRLTKLWAEGVLAGGAPLEVAPGLFRFAYARNTGAAFSMLAGRGWVLPVLTGVVLALLIALYIADKKLSRLARMGIILALAGGLGNLIDRLAYGYVIDFIELTFMRFAVFNIADVLICVGAAMAGLGLLLGPRKEKR